MFRRISFLFFFFILSGNSGASKIGDLIEKGKIDEAHQEIDRLSTAVRREGNLLYFQALLEQDGAASNKFLEAAIKAGLSPEYLEQDTYLTALFYMAEGIYERLETRAAAYLQRWENGLYRAEMLRLQALANEINGREERADRLLNNLIEENDNSREGAIGRLDRARTLYEKKKYIEAQNICRRLANTQYDEVIAPALYMLSYYSIEQKRIDDAILYYNLLKEGYPEAIGLDDLVDRFTQIDSRSQDRTAEEITGMFYSIQVGVFSVKGNANSLAKDMKKYGEKVEVNEKVISEKKYYVVYVGRFKSTNEAVVFKERLESSENEAFQVVAR